MESDNDSDIGDILDDLLANANDTDRSEPKKKMEELNFNFLDSEGNIKEAESKFDGNESSVVHDQDVDSSDDEDKKNFEEQKYSDYGRNLKNMLKRETSSKPMEKLPKTQEKSPKIIENLSRNVEKLSNTFVQNSIRSNGARNKIRPESGIAKSKDVYSDPIFGLRLVKPLISSAELVERMKGRKAVTISKVKYHLLSESSQDDWVIAGVLINRSPTKKSQKGTSYCIWKLTDLGDQMNIVSVFLFGGAYKLFWKTATGVAVAILNPGVMDSKDSTIDQATLSVDNAQKVLILGNSRDMGKCKSTKKNGEPCSNIVNISQCEYCVYHVKQEYKKASKRADIQSNGTSNGFASAMAKKAKTPLPGMYSQNINNQNFTPILAKRNEKLHAKDSARLALLRGAVSTVSNLPEKLVDTETKKKSFAVETTSAQLRKDLERLNKLRGWNISQPMPVARPLEAPSLVSETKKSSQLSTSLLGMKSPVPCLGTGVQGGKIDFSQPITKRHVDKARLNALRWIKENGTVKQSNPNKILESRDKKVNAGIKRQRESSEDELASEKNSKRALISDKFMEIMQAKSSHVDLVEKSEEEEKDKYFNKLEVKERMEEKMMNTFKIECKAVKCLICKYTAYSGSDFCKEQKHPLRVINAMKSFFKCHDCGNRTTTLDRIPTQSCTKCQSSHWVKAAMMAEKNTSIPSAVLSIRGGEEKFIGSASQDANINLLVPDSGTTDS